METESPLSELDRIIGEEVQRIELGMLKEALKPNPLWDELSESWRILCPFRLLDR